MAIQSRLRMSSGALPGPALPSYGTAVSCCGANITNTYTVRYQIGNVGTTVVFLDKAEQDAGRGSCKKLAQRKNRRMRGCTG